ncbi:MAG: YgaP-like transmembrane domain [Pseudomonadota bacterium]
MIKQNLGAVERKFRLAFGIILAIWAFAQPSMGVLEWLALLAAACLILNFLSGRCYLWKALNMNSCDRENQQNSPSTDKQGNVLPDQ